MGYHPTSDGNRACKCGATRIVNITIKDVNEAPRMTLGPTRNSKDENEDMISLPPMVYNRYSPTPRDLR